MNEILNIQNLSFSYKDHPIFNNLNLTIYSSTVNFIIGPNGSGKTTLMKILFFNKNKYFKTDDVQFVWEFQNLYENLTVLENLKIYFNLNVKKRLKFEDQLNSILKYWDLKNYLKKPVSSLSYGYRQKVHISRGIIVQPDVLLIDEPFLGLDYSSYLTMLRIIQETSNKITFFIFTQNPTVVQDYAKNSSKYQVTVVTLSKELSLYCIQNGSKLIDSL
ncbi:MAG: ATP-binding cassette domain-containing protein [bacterium]